MSNRWTREELRRRALIRAAESAHQRLSTIRNELDVLAVGIDTVIAPRRRRRSSTRKSFVDKVGNLVRFPQR
jgi:hypothetical protein